MNETTLKFKPGGYWNIAQYESWFSDMAQQGLHLKKVGACFAHFSKGEPKQTNYRIDIAPQEILPIQKEKYAKKGWGYVTSYGRSSWNEDYVTFNVYSSPTEINAPELYDDLSKQACQMKCYGSNLFEQLLILIPFFAFSLVGYLYVLFSRNKPYLSLLRTGVMPDTIEIVFLLILLLIMLKGILTIHTLRKSLFSGSPMNHSAPWKKTRNTNIIFYSFLIIVALFAFVSLPVQIATEKDRTLPAENNELPIVRLSEIEQNPNLVRVSDYGSDGSYDFNNYYHYEWKLFAPVQYEARESGTVPDVKNKDGGEYSPSVHSEVYKSAIPFINEKVLYDLIDDKNYYIQCLDEIHSPDFDKLFIRKEYSGSEVFAVKGRGIMYVRYCGNADTDTVTAAVLQKINKIA